MSTPLRRFSFIAFLGTAVVACFLAFFYRSMAVHDLKHSSAKQNEALARVLSNSLSHMVFPLLNPQQGADADTLRAVPGVAELHDALVGQLSGLTVAKIKIYTPGGLTVFSTQPDQVGVQQTRNSGVIGARSGHSVSSIVHKESFNAFDHVIEDSDLIQSYIPIRDMASGGIVGVFEVYSDVTTLLGNINVTQRQVVLGVIAILGLFYIMLVLYFRRTDLQLQAQERANKRYVKNVENANEMLEQRVDERTAELAKSSRFLQSVIDGVYDPIMVIDKDLHVTAMNQSARKLLPAGHDPAEPVFCYALSHNRDTPCNGQEHPCTMAEALELLKPVTMIHTHYNTEGDPRLVEVMATPLRDEAGEIQGIVETNHDITEHVRALEAQQESETRSLTIMNNVVDSIIVSDEDGIIESCNPATEKLFGYVHNQLIGQDVNVLVPEQLRDRHDQAMKHFVKSGQHRVLGMRGREFEGKRKDGSTFPLEIWVNEMLLAGKRKFLAVIRDLTEQKRAERELEEAWQKYFHREKIADIGQLASGIIHEVGNPIAAISGAVRDIRDSYDPGTGPRDAETLNNLDMIAEQTERLASLTRQISEFASPRPGQMELLDLNGLIRSTCNLVRFDSRWKDIVLNLELDPMLPAVKAIPDQLTQVFMNLLKNAADACEGIKDHKPVVTVLTETVNGSLHASVTDNGKGMDEKTRNQALDPFFTTKAAGTGSGLGLSLCNSMLERIGGRMGIGVAPGEGVTIDIYLPLEAEVELQVN